MMRSFSWTLLVGCFLLSGCEDPFIDPFVPGKHYTVYGYINAFDVEHFVRVIPVRRTPEIISNPNEPQAEIDAVVTSVDLSTNTPIRWTHKLQQLDDGTYGHIFSGRFVVRVGHRYRLVIRRSDGVETTAETTVPNLSTPIAAPAYVTSDSISQVLKWPGAGIPQNIEVVYCAKPVGTFSCDELAVDYGRSGRRTADGWEVEIALGRDLKYLRQTRGYERDVFLELSTAEVRFTSLDRAWLVPIGAFDPYEFAQPNALTNVENGFGFWGSVARAIYPWRPDADAIELLGYVPPE